MKTLTASLACLVIAAGVAAALGSDGKAPALEPQTPWMAILYTVAALAAICVVAFKRSGRTHLD